MVAPHFHNRNRVTSHRSPPTIHAFTSLPSPYHILFIPTPGGTGLFLPISSGWGQATLGALTFRPACAGPTLARGPVLSQGVASWAGAHVGAFGVVAAEGTEEGIQGALVHVWGGQWMCWLGGDCLRDPCSLPPHLSAQVLEKSYPHRSSWGRAQSHRRRRIRSLR